MIYFIFGILFIQFGLPILEGVTALLLTILEALKGYFGVLVSKYNIQMRNLREDDITEPKQKIGFCIEEDEYE